MLRVIVLVLLGLSFPLHAGRKLVPDDFLHCSAHYSTWSYLLKSRSHEEKAQQDQADKKAKFHLQIAEALANKTLREEFVRANEVEMAKAQDLLKHKGRYFPYWERRNSDCSTLVKDNQAAITEAMDRFYKAHGDI